MYIHTHTRLFISPYTPIHIPIHAYSYVHTRLYIHHTRLFISPYTPIHFELTHVNPN